MERAIGKPLAVSADTVAFPFSPFAITTLAVDFPAQTAAK
jgi:hypothetical protein